MRTTHQTVAIIAMTTFLAALGPHPPAHAAGSITYTYDSQGRIYTAVYVVGTTTITETYSYDPAGNRTSVVTQ